MDAEARLLRKKERQLGVISGILVVGTKNLFIQCVRYQFI